MTKLRWILLLSMIMTFLTFDCLADVILIDQNTAYEFPRTYLLRNGDELHCLVVSHDKEYLIEASTVKDTIYLNHMDAVCWELQNGELVPCQSHCADRWTGDREVPWADLPADGIMSGLATSPQNETFVILGDHSVYRWAPGEEDPWQYQCTLDTTQVPYEYTVLENYYAQDGVLYACFAESADGGYIGEGTAFSFSLETGAGEKICTMPTLYEIYPAGDNTMLVVGDPARSGGASNYFYDTVTGKTTHLANSYSVSELMSDEAGGWYFAGWDGIYYLHADGELESVVQLSLSASGNYLSLSNDKKTAYFYTNSRLFVYSLITDHAKEDHTLVLAGSLNEYGWNSNDSMPDLTEFYAENPGLQINTIDYPSSFDDVVLALLSGSDDFDILVMECSTGSLQSLLDKGFYVDLADNDSIVSFMQDAYPVWSEPCIRGDAIAALPIGARNVWTFMVNKEIWDEEGLGAFPTTYDELFDCIEEWNDQGILDFYPLFYQGQNSFDRLLHRIMVDHIGQCKREGTRIVFENETLLHLLGRLEDIRPILQAHDARNVTGDALLPEGILTALVHRSSSDYIHHCEPLPLGLTNAQDRTESVFFTVLIINPNSARIDLAKAYLSYLAQHPSTWAQCVLLQGAPDGVREKGYEDATERYEQLIPELNEQLETAIRERDDAVVQELERQKEAITSDYLNQWEVAPQVAEKFYQVLPYLTVLTSDGYGFLHENGADLMDMFSAGQIDCLTLVKRLDERMWMAEMEGSR